MKYLIIFACVLGAIFVEGQFVDEQDQNQEETDEYSDSGADCDCGQLYQPVCGQNEQTYPNACEAECNKESLQCEGTCPCPRSPSDSPTQSQTVCPVAIQKVCAENGKTYDNACEAENQDLGVQCEGECPCPGNAEENCPLCCTSRTPECQGQRVDCSQCSRK
ncbi:hypothetical protein TCAL_13173 [Tigriopus californicus]|nr:hypothetical protein TCAL_13173 [Tigriopus californicus]